MVKGYYVAQIVQLVFSSNVLKMCMWHKLYRFRAFSSNVLKRLNAIVGGQDLSFCVGFKAPFTSKSTSEEEETFGKTPY